MGESFLTQDEKNRFFLKVNFQKGGCWLWTGAAKDNGGYGQFPTKDGERRSNRIAYRLWVGPIPEGAVVRHKCDVGACCNPDHLELGTQAQNVADAWERGRAVAPPRLRGEQVSLSKLTEEQVLEIRALYDRGEQLAAIGRAYGITEATAGKVAKRQLWTHVGEGVPEDVPRAPVYVCRRGRPKLTEDEVRTIRVLCDRGFMQKDIARLFGVGRNQIGQIGSRKSWVHLAEEQAA